MCRKILQLGVLVGQWHRACSPSMVNVCFCYPRKPLKALKKEEEEEVKIKRTMRRSKQHFIECNPPSRLRGYRKQSQAGDPSFSVA